ncbi:hypothetical protein BCR42DRAFT_403782 [Absidia repens]|uniref:Uncharacterized protein n=1 Tax=Absidia repens TaxID=90262 RepID=A0A1X2IVE0_9FUNG|nr:hypothetical protein BCR42DRAFT_403782 [Absidia repens]
MLTSEQDGNEDDYLYLYRFYHKFVRKSKRRYYLLENDVLPWLQRNSSTSKHKTEQQPCQHPITFWEQLKGYRHPKNQEERLLMIQGLLIKWWHLLLDTVLKVDYNERHVYFDCICEIMIRPEFLELDSRSTELPPNINQESYDKIIAASLMLAKKKLNHNVVFSDMMTYSAKILAICFFKVPELATTILCGLDLRPVWIHRLQQEMGQLSRLADYKQDMKKIFPRYLHPLIGASGWEYQQFIHNLTPNSIDKSSVWMARLTRNTGELYTLFFKHLHVVLATYLVIVCPEAQKERLQCRNTMLVAAPCYLYFSGYYLYCVENFVSHMVRSVTLDTANDSSDNLASWMSTKPHYDKNDKNSAPRNLATKHHRSTSTKKSIQMKSLHDYESGPNGYRRKQKTNDAVSGRQHHGKPQLLEDLIWVFSECLAWSVMMAEPCGRFHDMINVIMRALILTTEVGNSIGVFGIFDFVEASMLQLQHYRLQTRYHPPLDQPFLLHTIHIVLAYSDHSTTLLRVLSFVYSQFKFLTSRAGLLDYLCNRILLDTVIFERLFLHWGANVRNFFWRCLVWRVGCIWKPRIVYWSSDLAPVVETHNIHVCNRKDCEMVGFIDHWDKPEIHGFQATSDSFIKVESKLRKHTSLLTHIILETLFDSFHQQYKRYQDDQILGGRVLEGWEKPTAIVPYSLMPSVLTDSPTSLLLELTSNKKMNTQGLVRSNTRSQKNNPDSSSSPLSTSPPNADNVIMDAINNIRRRSISSAISSISRKSGKCITEDDDDTISQSNDDDGDDNDDDEVGYVPAIDMETINDARYRDIWFQYYAVPIPLVDPVISTAPIRRPGMRPGTLPTLNRLTTSKLVTNLKDDDLDNAGGTSTSNSLYLLRGYGNSGIYPANKHQCMGKVITDMPNMEYDVENTIRKATQWRYRSCHHSYAIQQVDVSSSIYQEYLQHRKPGIPKLLLDWPRHWVLKD